MPNKNGVYVLLDGTGGPIEFFIDSATPKKHIRTANDAKNGCWVMYIANKDVYIRKYVFIKNKASAKARFGYITDIVNISTELTISVLGKNAVSVFSKLSASKALLVP
jgi:hypothetical protein